MDVHTKKVKIEPGISIAMANEPEELEDVKLHTEVELKPEDSVLKEKEIVRGEDAVIYEIIPIKEEPEPIQDDFIAEKDIKQESIEFGEHKLNIPTEEFDTSLETNWSNGPSVSEEPAIKLEETANLPKPPAQKPKPSNLKKECEHCGKSFVTTYRLALHRVKKHGSTEIPVTKKPASKTTHPRIFHCDLCDKSYHLQTYLVAHRTNVHGVADAQLKKQTSTMHTCKHCKKQISNWGALVYHLKNVHGKSIDKSQFFKCSSCLKHFATDEEMVEHLCLKETHLKKERPFKCDLCEKDYPAKMQLESHYSVHPEYHNLKCDECSKGFFNERELNSHKRNIHKAKESYIVCVICNKQLKNQKNWKTHQQVHADLECCCEKCGKTFKTKQSLNFHVRNTHAYGNDQAIPCTVCEKIVKGKRALQKHMRYHTNDGRFKCSFPRCDKTFRARTNLNIHEQTHTKDYKYKCKFCEYGSVRQKQVQLHEQRKHNHNDS